MPAWIYFLVLLSWKHDLVGGIRILDLRVPAHASEGGTALLGCQFDMEGDELYCVKWYKDNREFYRYVPNNRIPTRYFKTAGVTVDITRSSSTVVALTKLNEESAGTYRCEVSGEGPKFTTVHQDKYITIYYLPKDGPVILGLKERYDFGDRANLNCSSSGSKPEAQLKWLVNDKPVPKEHLKGPWTRISQKRIDTMETILELRFTVMPRHFKNGVLTIKCQAIIAPLYQEEVVHQIAWDENIFSTIASPIGFTEESLLLPSPVYNEVKYVGLPPLHASEKVTDNESNHQARLYAQNLILILLLFRLVL